MKVKVAVSTALFLFLGYFSVLQFAEKVLAARVSFEGTPISYPITAPITSPITPTLTPTIIPTMTPVPTQVPVASFKLTGKVTFTSRGRKVSAAGVTIKAINTQTREKLTAKTDKNGRYLLNVKKGKYQIEAEDKRAMFIVPRFHFETVKNKNISGVDFMGFLRNGIK
jgi:hypothetical protein